MFESSTFFSLNSFAFFITLFTLCLPLNVAAIASHLPSFPTRFFTIYFFNTSTSSSLHSFSSSTIVVHFLIPEDSFLFLIALLKTTRPTATTSLGLHCLDLRCEDFLLASSSGQLTSSPWPSQTLLLMMEGRAKGLTRRESASQKRRNLMGYAWRKKRERVMKSEKRETMEKNDLVGFWFEYKR